MQGVNFLLYIPIRNRSKCVLSIAAVFGGVVTPASFSFPTLPEQLRGSEYAYRIVAALAALLMLLTAAF